MINRLVALMILSLASEAGTSRAQNVPPNAASVAPADLMDSRPVPRTLENYKRMSIEELMNQEIISVSKEPQAVRDAPAAIFVVTSDDIRRYGASSIPEALRLADNLDVAQLSSSQWRISARGFNASVGNKLLVLMDGRSIYSPLFSGVIWNMQDYLMPDLDRIEAVSGPGGTLWGANAVNGVINIVSKDAKDTQGLYAEAGGGTLLEDFVGVRYGGTLASNVYYRVYGKYFDRGALVYPDGSSAHDAWNRGQGGMRIDSDASLQNHLMFEGGGFIGDNDVQPAGQGTPQYKGNSSGGHALGRWTHTFNEESDLYLQAYYDHTHLNAPFQGAGTIPPGSLVDSLDTVDLQFQQRFPVGERNNVVWGLEYRFIHDVNRPAPLVAFLPERLDQNMFSAFLQDEIKLHDRVYLTLGSKVEHNDYTGAEYEPNARLRWTFAQNQMLWAAVSRAVRTPSRFDRDLYQPDPRYGEFLVGNNSFSSESVVAYELGYRASLSSQVSGSLSLFYNDYDDLRSLNLSSAGTPPVTFANNLRGYTYGAELSGDYQVVDWWRLHAGYDLLEEHITVGSGGDLNGGFGETSDPKHQVFFRSSMDLPLHLEFDATFRWIDQIFVNAGSNLATVPAYPELDLRLAWRPRPNFEVSLVGQNLIHDQHFETGYPNGSQEEVPRSVYGKIAWSF